MPNGMSGLPPAGTRRVCVVGAGLGGLALAIRLQSAGLATTLIDRQDTPGGIARARAQDGFTFDGGPSVLIDPAALGELWSLSGRDIAEDIALMRVEPFWRLHWSDGASLDMGADAALLRAGIARLAPGDLAGYEDFLQFAAEARRESATSLGLTGLTDTASLLRAAPALLRQQAWRSLYARVASFVKSPRLRQALSFPVLLAGGNPTSASAVYALLHQLAREGGVWWPRGGSGALAAAMAALFERLGGTLKLGDAVSRIHTIGDRASEVETASGWRERFDAVASGADLVHTYRELLAEAPRAAATAQRFARKTWSPGAFVLHFALDGQWPAIPHHTLLFGPRYRALLADIFEHGVLPRDQIILLDHPSATDPSLAPAGQSVFRALVPVAHCGKLPVDWGEIGPVLAERVLSEIGLRFIPDIHDRILRQWHSTPADLAQDTGAYMGAGWSLEPTLTQSGAWRAPHRDSVIRNLYLVGAGTHPGAGVPGVLAGARITAARMLEDLRS